MSELWYITDGKAYGYVVAATPLEALQTATGTIVDEEFESITPRLKPGACDEQARD
ncbi:hypothetical protein [Alicyclobacillus sendaiensis]|uniref:hypothetical protein n=1 Tax=Alicyclobacillus sendaiensis TaxID=192387 RepID=UPI000AAA7355|nr:hypothetical protein [Alicyclobacillus sendaiensis]